MYNHCSIFLDRLKSTPEVYSTKPPDCTTRSSRKRKKSNEIERSTCSNMEQSTSELIQTEVSELESLADSDCDV